MAEAKQFEDFQVSPAGESDVLGASVSHGVNMTAKVPYLPEVPKTPLSPYFW
jgi:hypothetical protein